MMPAMAAKCAKEVVIDSSLVADSASIALVTTLFLATQCCTSFIAASATCTLDPLLKVDPPQ